MTTEAPAKAPTMTERNPDRVKAPVTIVPPPASMTSATPRLAPELMPSIDGSASGLLKTVCSISPDTDKAAPQSRAVIHWGKRDSHTMKLQLAFSTSFPINMSHTAEAGMLTAPRNKLPAISRRMITASIPP